MKKEISCKNFTANSYEKRKRPTLYNANMSLIY